MKKIIILKHGGGELANQLWNYASVYAFGLELKTAVSNPSFFEYHSQFNLLKNELLSTRLLSKLFSNYRGRKQNYWKKLWRAIYAIYPRLIEIFNGNNIISSENMNNTVVYLPPTVDKIETAVNFKQAKNAYMSGWLFRNPVGLTKFRDEIVKTFAPKPSIKEKVDSTISDLRRKYTKIIGIHIRQWDYKTWKGGKYFLEQNRIRQIMNEYVQFNRLNLDSTVFLIMSDGTIDLKYFNGLNIHISKENAVTDLFLLSRTDAIIGSDSSFGHFASWYGNIPHIVMKNEAIDWDYYKNRTNYFQNKYCTMVHF